MSDDLLIQTEGAVGRLRLNRPKALHALNRAMCDGMLAALEAWRSDAGVFSSSGRERDVRAPVHVACAVSRSARRVVIELG